MNDLLRPRHGQASEKVSFVELFFDLVFVFAITQLSHSLIGHFSPLGALQTLMLLLAVWWVWVFTAWVTNWLDPEKLPVRCLLLVMMIVGLVLSAAIPSAAADEFVLAHPNGHTDAKTAIAVLGGAALYLLGNVLFKKAISGRTPWSHLVAIAALGMLGAATAHLAPWLLGTLTAVVLVTVAWWERYSRCLRN